MSRAVIATLLLCSLHLAVGQPRCSPACVNGFCRTDRQTSTPYCDCTFTNYIGRTCNVSASSGAAFSAAAPAASPAAGPAAAPAGAP